MLATDTQETFEVIVAEDTNKPSDQRRRIVCPYMTMRETSAFRTAYVAARAELTDEKVMDAIAGVLITAGAKMHGPWKSPIEGVPTVESIRDNMTLATAMDFCEEIPTAQLLTERDRKKSARQSQSATANSAAAAAA